jgi:hypothetical protein
LLPASALFALGRGRLLLRTFSILHPGNEEEARSDLLAFERVSTGIAPTIARGDSSRRKAVKSARCHEQASDAKGTELLRKLQEIVDKAPVASARHAA